MRGSALILAALVLGCSGTGGSGGSGGSGASGGSGGGAGGSSGGAGGGSAVTAEQACTNLATAFCNKVNSVPGCASDPAQIPACTELCKALQASACKSKESAAMLCVAGANLKCNGAKADLGACEAQTKDANDCFKTLPPK